MASEHQDDVAKLRELLFAAEDQLFALEQWVLAVKMGLAQAVREVPPDLPQRDLLVRVSERSERLLTELELVVSWFHEQASTIARPGPEPQEPGPSVQ